MTSYEYRGWRISYLESRPVTGRWEAERHGVIMSLGSEDAAKRAVDLRLKEYPPRGD